MTVAIERSVLTEDPAVYAAVEKAAKKVSADWSGVVSADDLTNEIWTRLLSIEHKGRLHKDLTGWPSAALPENVAAVVYRNACRWAGGMCSDAKTAHDEASVSRANSVVLSDGELVSGLYDRDNVKGAFREYGPDLGGADGPPWVQPLRRALPELTDKRQQIIRRFAEGEDVDTSNLNKALNKLLPAAIWFQAEESRTFEGPGGRKPTPGFDEFFDGPEPDLTRRVSIGASKPASDVEMIQRFDEWKSDNPKSQTDFETFCRRWTPPMPPGPAKSLHALQRRDPTYVPIHRY